jgi:hypothetical protein
MRPRPSQRCSGSPAGRGHPTPTGRTVRRSGAHPHAVGGERARDRDRRAVQARLEGAPIDRRPRPHTHTHTYTHTHTHARTHTHTHTHARTYTRTHAHIHAHAHARTHARTHTHTRTRMHTRTHAHTHARTHAHACPPARTRTHVHARTHTHIGAPIDRRPRPRRRMDGRTGAAAARDGGRSPGADCGQGRASPVPAQTWQGVSPTPGAAVAARVRVLRRLPARLVGDDRPHGARGLQQPLRRRHPLARLLRLVQPRGEAAARLRAIGGLGSLVPARRTAADALGRAGSDRIRSSGSSNPMQRRRRSGTGASEGAAPRTPAAALGAFSGCAALFHLHRAVSAPCLLRHGCAP